MACSSGTPTGPGPIPPDPGPVVNNTPPVIGKFTVQGMRASVLANFAEVSEDLPISVEVTDADDDSNFNWSATANGAPLSSFTGTGRSVTWQAPADATTPADVTINLEVVETFTSQGKSVANRVTGSTTVRLHNSVKEVGDMARQFLLDFSDSSIPVSRVMRNFEPTCSGTADETSQVSFNRELFNIVGHNVGPVTTTVRFGGFCPFRNRRGDACAQVPVYWKSVFLKDNPESGNKAGDSTEAFGTDQVTAFYYRDQQQWRLCDSDFDGSHRLRAIPRGLVP